MTNKTNNDDERSKYDRLISVKDREMDDLTKDRRRIEMNFDELNDDLYRGYQRLSMINEEDLVTDNSEIIRLQQMNEQQEQFFRRQIKEVEEDVLDSYHQENKKLEKESEFLYEKRGELPLD